MSDNSLPSQFTAEVEARKSLILRNLQVVYSTFSEVLTNISVEVIF